MWDEQLWVPLETAQFRRVRRPTPSDRINAQVAPGFTPDQAIVDLERIHAARAQNPAGQRQRFQHW